MQMPTSQIVDELSSLFAAEIDVILAYGRAVFAVEPSPVRDELTRFGLEHQRHALVLDDEIVRQGGQMPEVTEPDQGAMEPGTAGAPSLSVTAFRVLEEIRGYEKLVALLYAKALAKDLPDDVREVLEEIHAQATERVPFFDESAAYSASSSNWR